MAVAVKGSEINSRPWMPVAFFGMSIVMVAVMGWSMWKDTHPEWRGYQEQYAGVERKILLQQKADLERKIQHPDFVGDYNKAKADYTASKATYDTASGDMDQTAADLEELQLELKPGGEEGGAADTASTDQVAATTSGPASSSDMAELDKEMGGSSGAGVAPAAAAGGAAATQSKPAASTPSQPSKSDLEELDKEMGGSAAPGKSAPSAPTQKAPEKKAPAQASAPSGGGKPSDADMAELDKEMSGAGAPKAGQADQKPATPAQASKQAPTTAAPAKGDSKDLDELDKEFSGAAAPKPTVPTATEAAAAASGTPAAALTFEEADFKIDEKAAQDKVESAHRDVLDAQRIHNKEMIGLPEDATTKRKLADTLLKQSQQGLTLAMDGLDLERKKAEVKSAAQIARWALDVEELKTFKADSTPASQARLVVLQASKKNLDDHMADLQRDLKLVNQRLERNKTGAPEVEQTYIDRLGVVDRCETCHKATQDSAFQLTAEPFRTHPGGLLKWHPVEKFGCTSCHGGSGPALEKFEAHGGLVGKGRPLLVGDQVQASCGKCHGESKELPGASVYLAGAQLFKSSGCLGCHKVEGLETPAKAGPDLDRVDEKVGPTWLMAWVKDPRSHSLEARMPNFGLTDDQAKNVAAYLMTQHGTSHLTELAPVPSFPADKVTAGNGLVHSLGCLGCHMIRGEGNFVGPELTNLRNKARPEWVYSWLQNPRAYLADARMPNFGLTREQAVDIGDYLLTVGTPKTAGVPFSPALFNDAAARAGAEVIAQRGCAGCHSIKGFDKLAAPELTHEGDKTADVIEFGNDKTVNHTIYDFMVEKLQNPAAYDTATFKSKMPKFGMGKDEAQEISTYLLARNSIELPPEYVKDAELPDTPMVVGRRIFTDHNCAGCHTLAGVGGKIGPDLTREGEKVQPGWLFGFLERPVRIRWWQDARMPNFSLSETDATALTQYLMELSNQPEPYEYTPPEKQIYPLAAEGAKHLMDLKCESCHPLGGKQSVAGGGDTKKLGPDLAMASTRLKPDWMLRFFRDPQAFSPGTQMPTFKQPDHVFQSIIDFLMKQHQP